MPPLFLSLTWLSFCVIEPFLRGKEKNRANNYTGLEGRIPTRHVWLEPVSGKMLRIMSPAVFETSSRDAGEQVLEGEQGTVPKINPSVSRAMRLTDWLFEEGKGEGWYVIEEWCPIPHRMPKCHLRSTESRNRPETGRCSWIHGLLCTFVDPLTYNTYMTKPLTLDSLDQLL